MRAVGDFLKEIFGEQTDVIDALAEGRNVDSHDIEPIEKILAEGALGHLLFEVAVCRADDADIRVQRLVAADAGKGALLENAEDFALHLKWHFTDLIEKKRALVALFEAPDPLCRRASESSLLVAEQLALEKVFRDSGAIDREEASVAPGAVVVDRTSDELLARATLARDHHSGVAASHAAHHFEDLLHGLGAADDFIPVLFDGELWLEGVCGAEFRCREEGGIGHDLQIKGELFLPHKIESPHFHGFDHRLGGAECASKNDHGIRRVLADFREELHAGEGMQIHLGEDEFGLFEAEGFVACIGGFLRKNACGFALELVFCPLQKVGVPVHQKNRLLLCHCPCVF